jgi:hypothetical protein
MNRLRRLRKATARLLYSLPGQAGRDPRGRVKRIPDCCRQLRSINDLWRAGGSDDVFVEQVGPETFRRSYPRCVLGADQRQFRQAIERYQGGCVFKAPPVMLAQFHNANITTKELLLRSSSGAIVIESALSSMAVLEASGILDSIPLRRPSFHAGSYVLLGHPWSFGYYHWLFEALPRLAITESTPLAEIPLIVPARPARFQGESLALAGVPEARLRRPTGASWRVEQVYFPTLPAPSGNPSPRAVAWLRNTFLGKGELQPRRYRRLYLTRSDATQRRLLNEKEVVTYLSGHGFEVYCSGQHSFAEQVSAFAGATCVVAPHGAAVSNMVFAAPGSVLVELFGPGYINGCYWALANILRQEYGCIIGEGAGSDYTVPIRQLADALSFFEQ